MGSTRTAGTCREKGGVEANPALKRGGGGSAPGALASQAAAGTSQVADGASRPAAEAIDAAVRASSKNSS